MRLRSTRLTAIANAIRDKFYGAALNMRFDNTTSLDPRITFSRTTNATLTNSAGLVANAPMNLLTFSEQFDNAAWTKSGATITANAVAAPDGTSTADALIETATTGNHQVYRLPGLGIATYTYSVYAKANGRTQFVIDQESGGAARFTLSGNGTAVALGANTVSIVAVGNGWYRCSNTFTVTGAFGIYSNLYNGSTTNYTGDGTSGIYIWGAQLELGSTATTYNPTTVKNLLGYTEHFDNAAWTKSNASITSGFTDIYGQPFAQKLVEDTVSANHQVSIFATFTVGTPYTLSIYAKAAERSWLLCIPNSITQGAAWFNLATGTVGTVQTGVTSATIQPVGNGWYRCNVSGVATLTSNPPTFRLALADNTTVYTGDGTSGIYIFGAQLSDSASVDPYVYQPVAAPSSVAYYGPRFDYDPVTLAPKGLLIEEQRTNLLTYSEQFDNAAWTATDATVTANADTSPDGTVDADKLVENTATLAHYTLRNITWTAATYTISVYAKAAGRSFAVIGENSTGGARRTWFNLSTGTVGTTSAGHTASIANAGNGWYRCSISFTATAITQWMTFYPANEDGVYIYAGNGTSGVYLWGAQLEAGAFATSYIPTVASQVTRAADSASMIGNNFARWYNQTSGTLFAEYLINGLNPGSSNAAYGISAGVTSDFITGRTTANQATNFAVRVGGADQVFLTSTTVAAGAVAKSAGAYTLNDFAFSANSGAAQTDTSGTLPVVTQMQIGGLTSASNPLNGTIKRIAYYNRRLSNTELQGITS